MPRRLAVYPASAGPADTTPAPKLALVDVDATLIKPTEAGVIYHHALINALKRFDGEIILFSHYSMSSLNRSIIKQVEKSLRELHPGNVTHVATILKICRDTLRTSVVDKMKSYGIDVLDCVYHSTPHRGDPDASVKAIHTVERALATTLNCVIDLLETVDKFPATFRTATPAINTQMVLFLAKHDRNIESHCHAEERALKRAVAKEREWGSKAPMMFYVLGKWDHHRDETVIFDDLKKVAAMAKVQRVRCCPIHPIGDDWVKGDFTGALGIGEPTHDTASASASASASTATVLAPRGHGAPPPGAKTSCWAWCC